MTNLEKYIDENYLNSLNTVIDNILYRSDCYEICPLYLMCENDELHDKDCRTSLTEYFNKEVE